MAHVQQVQKRLLVSLAQVAREINLNEGDYILVEQRDGGIFLKPVDWIDKNQKYFWTEEWQEKMQRSQEALEKGEYKTFDKMEEAIKDLEELANAGSNTDKAL